MSLDASGCEPLHLPEEVPVDGFQLRREGPLGRLVEAAPAREQVLVPRAGEGGAEGRWGIHPRTHLQTTRHRSGKPTKITV
ncbi:MAG: hypothetical protein ACKOHG_06270, partial [Planctomycetia bacterium]